MPKQEIAEANPPPDASQLPEALLKLKVNLETTDALSDAQVDAIRKFRRAADYIAAGELI
jgi:xylulose-5-phosphate/fructose-6-phosphate phosphoketolase